MQEKIKKINNFRQEKIKQINADFKVSRAFSKILHHAITTFCSHLRSWTLPVALHNYIHGNYSKLLFQGKVGRACGIRKGGNYLFQGFPFSRGCPCCWKESNCSSQLFFKNCFFGIFFKMQELQTKPSSFSRSIFFKTGPGQPFSRLWDGLHTKK